MLRPPSRLAPRRWHRAPTPRARYGYLPPPRDPPRNLTDGVRLAIVELPAGLDTDADVTANLSEIAGRLVDAGTVVEEAEIGWNYEQLITATEQLYSATYAPLVQRVQQLDPAVITSYARAFLETVGARTGPGAILEAHAALAAIEVRLGVLFDRYDALLLPTLAFPAPVAGEEYTGAGPVVAGRPQPDRWIVGTTVAFNLLSSVPAISVPTGFSREGVPTSVQVVGRPNEDAALLALAEAINRLSPNFSTPTARPAL